MSVRQLLSAIKQPKPLPERPPEVFSREEIHADKSPMNGREEPPEQHFYNVWQLAASRSRLPRVIQPSHLKMQLFPYQQEAYGAMIQDRRGILADEMGVGKTAAAIAYMVGHKEAMPELNKRGRIVLVIPAGLVPKWYQEMKRFVMYDYLNVVWAHRSAPGGVGIRDMPLDTGRNADVLVVTYEGMMLEYRDWCEADEPDMVEAGVDVEELAAEAATVRTREGSILYCGGNHMVIADEVHHVENYDTKRARAMRAIPRTGFWGLTGTPLRNHLTDFFSYFALMNVPYWQTMSAYKAWIYRPIDMRQTKENGDRCRLNTLHAAISAFTVRRRKADVMASFPQLTQSMVEFEDDAATQQKMLAVHINVIGEIEEFDAILSNENMTLPPAD
ncbi:P-loop containing nucleoside triphosphate hydrolase protein [Karstenula rhodostoma CBS 690.94]|uniref:P-loop containing nucleoside triphosphate hydrolase protein n=1 Tax=Karstenula rhodostoma CBS 690.94 TaxID=1392251 RepID=A0A9P4PK83_9PLEO|nr:P-loop containing nucleoside triphosphate hydrolase protein [Karstenula rhodostoma CBS 690.94]